MNENDKFLIYYAGHGYLDNDINKGFWLPINAQKEDPSNWISNSDITDQLIGIKSKHLLVIADSCFSGTLTRGIRIIFQFE